MPANQALQVFYGTLPLSLVVLAIGFRKHLLLKAIRSHVGRIEAALQRLDSRLVTVRTKAGLESYN
jgi:hypothetical protein